LVAVPVYSGGDASGRQRLGMTDVYITIDTEYSAGLFVRFGRAGRAENFRMSIDCATADGAVGVGYQMDMFDFHGLKAVFFVDPMPALIWGVDAIAAIVEPIVSRGHDVQLHLHSEWLAFAGAANPLGDRTGTNIKDFTLDEQLVLLRYASDMLIAAGAPRPVAFRAGNYGANDDTLRALAQLGMAYDTSHCPGIAAADCAISLSSDDLQPRLHCGIVEVPIGAIGSYGDGKRHAQITALSAAEMLAAVGHCRTHDIASFTLVSHSFELLSRDRQRINRIIDRRFTKLCRGLASMDGVETRTYADRPPTVPDGQSRQPTVGVLPFSPIRAGMRMAEQLVGNQLYGAG
jgi:hypothetical protein